MQAEVRDQIVSLVAPSFSEYKPGIPMVLDNQAFDWNNLPELFVTYEIKFQGGGQIGLSNHAKDRVTGHIYVTAYARIGKGSRHLLELLDWFRNAVGKKPLPRGQIEAAQPDGDGKIAGYFFEQMKFAFRADGA